MHRRAVLYCRVSRSAEESVSIDRQEAELRELADAEGWPVVAVFTDDGISGRVAREKADAALAMIAEGAAEVLLVWELSRWSRMGLTAVARLVEVLRERQDALFLAKREGLRSDQPAFGIMAAVIAEVAAMEAQSTRDRIRSMRAHVLGQTAPEEQRWLGGRVPFGYKAVDRAGGGKALEVEPVAAGHLQEAAKMLLAGRTITDATRYLNAHVSTPQNAGEWRVTTVRKLMQSPTLIGRTTQKVEVGQRADGSPIIEYRVVTDGRGMPIQRWEPAIDPATWAAVQELFKKRGPNQPRKAASWLSGQLICDLCGSVLYANSRKGNKGDSFRCANRGFADRRCPGVSIGRRAAEEYMEGLILRAIGGLAEYKVETRVEGGDPSELVAVAQSIEDVQAALAADGADYGELLPQLDALKAERRRLLEAPLETVTVRTPTGRTLADAWSSADIPERQFLLSDMLDGVRVKKPLGAGRGSRIEDRLEPVWMEHAVWDD